MKTDKEEVMGGNSWRVREGRGRKTGRGGERVN